MGEAGNGWLFCSPQSCLPCGTQLLLLGIGGKGDIYVIAIGQSSNIMIMTTFVREMRLCYAGLKNSSLRFSRLGLG